MLSNLISLTRFARAHRDHGDNLFALPDFLRGKIRQNGVFKKRGRNGWTYRIDYWELIIEKNIFQMLGILGPS